MALKTPAQRRAYRRIRRAFIARFGAIRTPWSPVIHALPTQREQDERRTGW